MEVITRSDDVGDRSKTISHKASKQEFTKLERLDTPAFHIAPAEGWLNDPNGPLLFNGTYHMFFQHLPGSAVWGFNLVWGHAASKDLVHWELLPHAIEPTPGTCDGDGCFSGCAVIDTDGTPALLYTGVRLRGSLFSGPLPPEEYDLGLPFIESQCVAYAEDPTGDWRLPYWRKSGIPFLTLPPPNVKLSGWRDPYVIGPPQGHPEQGWLMLIGSGIKDEGGTVLVYRSKTLTSGWQLAGELCSGLEADGTGLVWECPLLVEIPIQSSSKSNANEKHTRCGEPHKFQATDSQERQQEHDSWKDRVRRRHFFCLSPDACTNPSVYYLGEFQQGCVADHPSSTTRPDGPGLHVAGGDTAFNPSISQAKFLIKDALGPFRLDLGDILYAPNTLIDSDQGRVLIWAWMQEARKVAGTYTYAGCLSCPREMWLEVSESDPDHPRLVQRPCNELSKLRRQQGSWTWPTKQSHTFHPTLDVVYESCPHEDDEHNRKQEQQSSQTAGWTPQHSQPPGVASATSDPAHNRGELLIRPGQAYPIPCVQAPHLDIELQLSLVWPQEADSSNSESTSETTYIVEEDAAVGQDSPYSVCSTLSESTQQGTAGVESTQQGTAGVPAVETGTNVGAGDAAGVDTGVDVGVGRVGPQDQGDTVPPPAGACSGLVIRVWQAGVEGAAALLYCWATHVLEVVFEAVDPQTHEFSLAAPGCRRVGGVLASPPLPGQPLNLRVLLDHSLLEVFTGGGEVLSTRVYRGTAPPGEGAGIDLVSLGCTTRVVQAAAYEMQSCWVTSGPLPVSKQATEAAAAAMSAPGMPLPINSIDSPFASLIRGMSGMATPSQALSRAASIQEALPLDMILSRRESRTARSTRHSITGTPRDSVVGTPFANTMGTSPFNIVFPPPGPPPRIGMSPISRRVTGDVVGVGSELTSVGSQSQQQSHFTSALDAALAGLRIHQNDEHHQQHTYHQDSASEFGSVPNATFLTSPKVTRLLPANNTSLFPSMDNMRLTEMISSTGGVRSRETSHGGVPKPPTTAFSVAATSSLTGSLSGAFAIEPLQGNTTRRTGATASMPSPTIRVCGFNTSASPSTVIAAWDETPVTSVFASQAEQAKAVTSHSARRIPSDVNGHIHVADTALNKQHAASDSGCDSVAATTASGSSTCASADQQSSAEALPAVNMQDGACKVQQDRLKGKKPPSALTARLMSR